MSFKPIKDQTKTNIYPSIHTKKEWKVYWCRRQLPSNCGNLCKLFQKSQNNCGLVSSRDLHLIRDLSENKSKLIERSLDTSIDLLIADRRFSNVTHFYGNWELNLDIWLLIIGKRQMYLAIDVCSSAKFSCSSFDYNSFSLKLKKWLKICQLNFAV